LEGIEGVSVVLVSPELAMVDTGAMAGTGRPASTATASRGASVTPGIVAATTATGAAAGRVPMKAAAKY